jgi:hypothetical protein
MITHRRDFLIIFSCFLLFSLCCFSSCGNLRTTKLYLPNGKVFGHMPKTDNEVYKHAWKDGCESGLSTGFGKEFNKSFYNYTKDIRFVGYKYGDSRDLFNGKEITPEDKSLYNGVWYNMFKVCRDYAVGSFKAPGIPGWNPKAPGDVAGQWDDPTLVYEFNAWNNGSQNFAFW